MPASPKPPLNLEDGPTKYVDRPANEGKHGDGADEPNAGTPRDEQEQNASNTPPGTPPQRPRVR